jgi:hypothetical protein
VGDATIVYFSECPVVVMSAVRYLEDNKSRVRG